jgi:hypothetical protein
MSGDGTLYIVVLLARIGLGVLLLGREPLSFLHFVYQAAYPAAENIIIFWVVHSRLAVQKYYNIFKS